MDAITGSIGAGGSFTNFVTVDGGGSCQGAGDGDGIAMSATSDGSVGLVAGANRDGLHLYHHR